MAETHDNLIFIKDQYKAVDKAVTDYFRNRPKRLPSKQKVST